MSDELQDLLDQFRADDSEASFQASLKLEEFGDAAVDSLIEIIRDDQMRYLWLRAALALGHIRNRRAVEPLIGLLKNPTSLAAPLARKYTAYALSELADPRAVDVLIELLHERMHEEEEEDDGTITIYDEPEHETIEAAAGALARIGEWRGIEAVINRLLEGDHWHDHRMGEWGGEAAFQYLLHTLESNDLERCARAASLLGEFGDKRAVEPLINLLKTASYDRLRSSAAYGLSELHDPRAFVPLFLALKDTYDQARLHAAFGVSYFAVPRSHHPEAGEPDVVALVKTAVSTIGDAKIAAILGDAMRDSHPMVVRCALRIVAVFLPFLSQNTIHAQIIPQLRELTTSPDDDIRIAALSTLKSLPGASG